MKGSDGMAIDFHKLMLLEKQRLRAQRKKNSNNNNKKKNESKQTSSSDDKKTSNGNHGHIPPDDQTSLAPMNNQGRRQQQQQQYHHQEEEQEDWMLVRDLPLLDRTNHDVGSTTPSGIYYMPRFLPTSYQERLLVWLQERVPNNNNNNNNNDNSDKNNDNDPNGKWTTMKYGKRRVALFDGTTSSTSNYHPQQQQPQPKPKPHQTPSSLPFPLAQLCQALVQCGIFDVGAPPNHVLVNEYEASQGILPHTDGPAYLDRTATISIGGGDVLLRFTPRKQIKRTITTTPTTSATNTEVWLQGSGSLVVFEGDAYTNYCHGINDRVVDGLEYAGDHCVNVLPNTTIVTRGYRVSLTFRHKKEGKQ